MADDQEYDPDPTNAVPVDYNPFARGGFMGFGPVFQPGASTGQLVTPEMRGPERLLGAVAQHFYGIPYGLAKAGKAATDYAMQGLLPWGTNPPSAEEAQHATTDVAMGLLTPGKGEVPKGSVGMFGTQYGLAGDIPALERAARWERQGVNPEDIRQNTGWFRNPAGKWRWEYPDKAAELTGKDVPTSLHVPGLTPSTAESIPLSEFLRHDQLYRDLPEMAALPVTHRPNMQSEATYTRPQGDYPYIAIRDPYSGASLSNTLHEVMHGVQHIADELPEGNPPKFVESEFDAPMMDQALSKKGIDPDTAKLFTRYRNLLNAGHYYTQPIEVEARNVQARQLMSPDKLQSISPFRTQDMPQELQAPTGFATEKFLRGEGQPFYKGPLQSQFQRTQGGFGVSMDYTGQLQDMAHKLRDRLGMSAGGLGPEFGAPVPVDHDPYAHEKDGSMGWHDIVKQPAVADAIANPQIDNSRPVPYAAGADDKSSVTHIDPKIPQYDPAFTNPEGQPLDFYKYLNIHEQVEHFAMEHGEGYESAHINKATPAEHAAIRADGGDPAVYERILKPYIHSTEKETLAGAPPTLYRKPYAHTHEAIRDPNRGPDTDPYI